MSPDSSARPPFPSYLLPSISFPRFRRRRQTSNTSASESSPPSLSTSPNSSTSSSPGSSPTPSSFLASHFQTIKELLQNHVDSTSAPKTQPLETTISRIQPDTLKCITCGTDLAFTSQIVSKGFTGRHGRAYLVAPPPTLANNIAGESDVLINTKVGRSVNRQLLTGAHVVADVSCVICQAVLGWKYVDAKETAQRYKIGKFILETKRVIGCSSWEDVVDSVGEGELEYREGGDEGLVVFDSEDEDECEDLFAGTWDAETVAKRRGRRFPMRKQIEMDT